MKKRIDLLSRKISRLKNLLKKNNSSYEEKVEDIKLYCEENNISIEQYINNIENKFNRFEKSDFKTDEEKEIQLRVWTVKLLKLLKERNNILKEGIL